MAFRVRHETTACATGDRNSDERRGFAEHASREKSRGSRDTQSKATRRRSPKREHRLLGSTHADKSGAGATRFFLTERKKVKGKGKKPKEKSKAKPNPRKSVVHSI